MSRDLTKGDIPTLILAVLAEGSCHGYAIAREVERRSGEILKLRESALYPALRALETAGFIRGEWQESESRPARRVYSITTDGQVELEERTKAWKQYAQAMNALIGAKPHAKIS